MKNSLLKFNAESEKKTHSFDKKIKIIKKELHLMSSLDGYEKNLIKLISTDAAAAAAITYTLS